MKVFRREFQTGKKRKALPGDRSRKKLTETGSNLGDESQGLEEEWKGLRGGERTKKTETWGEVHAESYGLDATTREEKTRPFV